MKRFQIKDVDGHNTIIDTENNLIWANTRINNFVSILETAQGQLEEINSQKYAGHNDWRLPTVDEAETLICKKRLIRKYSGGYSRFSYLPKAFDYPEPPNFDSIWTSTYNLNGRKAFIVDFTSGESELSSVSAFAARLLAVRRID